MNGFERVKRGELDIIKSSLKKRKEQLEQKVLTGDFKNPKDEESIRKSISTITDLISFVDDTIATEESRNKVEKSNYTKIPTDILKNLEIQLRARKEYIGYLIENGKYSSTEEEHKLRRETHRINVVYDLVKGAYKKTTRLQNAENHIGETALASDGKTVLTITEYRNSNNITVISPDGRKLQNQTYSKFKNGRIATHADYVKKKYGTPKRRVVSNEDELLRKKYGAVVAR